MSEHWPKFLGVVLVLILFVGAVFYLGARQRAGKYGRVRVFSSPSEVAVFLDNEKVGQTPWTATEVERGFYLVGVGDDLTAGSWEGKVKVEPEGGVQVYRTLSGEGYSAGYVFSVKKVSRGEERLAITSVPGGAGIWFNGEEQGKTPVVWPVTAGEEMLVRLESDGWQAYEETIRLQEGQAVTLDVSLARQPLAGLAEKSLTLSTDVEVLDLDQVIPRKQWTKERGVCGDEECSTKEWQKVRYFTVKLPQDEIDAGDWLSGTEYYAREKLSLPDLPFAYVISSSGTVYAGVGVEDLDFSSWDLTSVKEGLTVSKGECPVVILIEAGQEDISASSKTAAARLYKAIHPVAETPEQVRIKSTPTGFLNFRGSASLNANVLGQVYPGEVYELLEEQSQWFKIKVGDSSGWVYRQYAEKV